jgi:hypothetical protein
MQQSNSHFIPTVSKWVKIRVPSSLVAYLRVVKDISPRRKELSSVSLAIGTWMERRGFVTERLDIESNSPRHSPSDIPSGSFTKQLTCLVACFPAVALPVTFPELCQSLNISPNIASPSERLAQSCVTVRAVTLTCPELCRSLNKFPSERLAQSFVAG